MANYKSTYQTKIDAVSGLHERASQTDVNRKAATARFSYTFVGGEVTNEYIELGPLFAPGARIKEMRVRLPAHLTAFLNGAGKLGKLVNTTQPALAGSWTRSTTTATVTTTVPHGLVSGQTLIAITNSSSVAAIVNGNVTVTVTGEFTFTFTCLNAGDASGTLNFAQGAGSIGYLTAAATLQSASSGTAAGVGATVTLAAVAGQTYELAKDDSLIFTLTDHTDIDAGRRLEMEVDYNAP